MGAEILERTDDLNSRAVAAKSCEGEMESLINDFRPFLHSRAARYSLKDDGTKREELFGAAMFAFYEAIQGYDIEKGHFFPFANNVVRYNLIDHVRKIYRSDERVAPLDDYDEEQPSTAIYELSVRAHQETRRREHIAEEIEQFKSELSGWGITMESLAQQSPKHKKLSDTYKELIKQMLGSPDIIQTIQIKRYFPIKAISEISKLPPKKLERARTFILASLIIKMGDYDFLSEYVS